jgi:hypothetical protein
MTRFCALAAPLFLLSYGILRYVDGLDGHRGGGPAWYLGHSMFFVAMVLFAALMVGLRGLVTRLRPLATGAMVGALFGAGCFLWGILDDLFASFPDLVGPLKFLGPALFQVGAVVLLTQLSAARRAPFWTPILMLVGFGAIGVDLDLLPFGAVVIFVGLLPLARQRRSPVDEVRWTVPR